METHFLRGNLPDKPAWEPANIADRKGWIAPGGPESSAASVCLAQVPQRRFTVPTGAGGVELLRVSVSGPQPMKTLCQIAIDLTATAVPKLPQ